MPVRCLAYSLKCFTDLHFVLFLFVSHSFCLLVLVLFFSIPIFLSWKCSVRHHHLMFIWMKKYFPFSFEWLMNGHLYRFHFWKLNDIFIQLNEKVLSTRRRENEKSMKLKCKIWYFIHSNRFLLLLSPSPIIMQKALRNRWQLGFAENTFELIMLYFRLPWNIDMKRTQTHTHTESEGG